MLTGIWKHSTTTHHFRKTNKLGTDAHFQWIKCAHLSPRPGYMPHGNTESTAHVLCMPYEEGKGVSAVGLCVDGMQCALGRWFSAAQTFPVRYVTWTSSAFA